MLGPKATPALAAALLLALLPGCFGPGAGTPEPVAASQWRFAQGSVEGGHASADPAVALAALPTLGQAWEAVTKGAVTGTPTAQDGHVFVATWKGMVYSLDLRNGSVAWSRDLGAQVDASVTLAEGLALVGDSHGHLHALDAVTGAPVWDRLVDDHLNVHLYSTPLVVPQRGARAAFIVQGVGSDQESWKLQGDKPIDFRGNLVALSLKGDELWRSHFVPEGQTGAPVWGTPAYDAGTDRIVVGTGNAYTAPAGNLTDAIVAVEAGNGTLAWHVQGLAHDIFTQMKPESPDSDFGSSPLLFKSGNRTLAGIGQKSAVFWAVEMASGKIAWKSGPVEHGEGIIGDAALAGDLLIVPYTNLKRIAALHTMDGTEAWRVDLAGVGYSDPVAVPGGVIVADGSGQLRGLDASTGHQVWNATVGSPGGVWGGLSVAEGHLLVPVVRGGFLAATGGVMAFAPKGGQPTLGVAGSTNVAPGQIVMEGFQFSPNVLHATVGSVLTLTNRDPATHTVTAVDGSFDVTVEPGDDATLHLDHAGTFKFYCKPHSTQAADGTWQGMTGTLVVV